MGVPKTMQSPAVGAGPDSSPPAVLVTGASGALGQSLCSELVASGQRVIAIVRNAERVPPALEQPGVVCVAANVTDAADFTGALSRIIEQWGRVQGAVLCAGGWEGGKPVNETASEVWQRVFASNLDSARVCIGALVGHMRGSGGGSIVAIGARTVERPWEGANAAAYAASKAALVTLVKTAAQEALGTGVRLNAVMPSTLDTPGNRAVMPQANFSRWVTLSELNNVITFLLSPKSSAVSGAAIPVYGRL
jgi:NAD(P)-dependent dehydrogenase (short-subunit alcohol dehydrogenase family)